MNSKMLGKINSPMNKLDVDGDETTSSAGIGVSRRRSLRRDVIEFPSPDGPLMPSRWMIGFSILIGIVAFCAGMIVLTDLVVRVLVVKIFQRIF